MKSLDLLSKTIHFHTHRWITKQNQTFVFKSLDLLILRQDVRPHCPDLLGSQSLTNFGFFCFFAHLPVFFGHFGSPALDLLVFLVTSQAFLVILH